MAFKFLEHISDAFVEAYGSSLEEAFENVAIAMFEIMTDTSKVKPVVEGTISVEAENEYELLYSWLEELLIKFEIENTLFAKFKVRIRRKEGRLYLVGKAWGEHFNPKKHPSKVAIKAVTYHLMEISKKEDKVIVRVLFDI